MNFFILTAAIVVFLLIIIIIIILLIRRFKKRDYDSTLFGAESSISLKKNTKKVTPPLIIKKDDALKVMEALDENKAGYGNTGISNIANSNMENLDEKENKKKVEKSLIKKESKKDIKPKKEIKPTNAIVDSEIKSVDLPVKNALIEPKPLEQEDKKNDGSVTNKPVEIGYIRFDNIDNFLEKINDSDLKNMLQYLREKNYDFIDKRIITKTFSLKENFLEYLKRELTSFLKDVYDNLKSRISELRRKGEDVQHIDFRLMSVPLKIKLFESSFSKKDFLNILEIIGYIEEELKKYNKPPETK